MNDADDDSLTWIDVIDATIDEEVSRDEAIQLTAEDLAVDIPIRFDVDADADADVMSEKSPPDHDRARWRFDGTLNVTIEGVRGPLAEWLRLWTRE